MLRAGVFGISAYRFDRRTIPVLFQTQPRDIRPSGNAQPARRVVVCLERWKSGAFEG